MHLKDHSSDRLVLIGDVSRVERDAEGVPSAFLVFRAGPLSLTRDGVPFSAMIGSEDLAAFETAQREKGDLPIDCEHLLYWLAQAKGMDEADLMKSDPVLGEAASAGMFRLEKRGEELWAVITAWSQRARELLSGAGDGVYRYFSPAIRGLQKPPLRITSITLTNKPALNGLQALDSLAANDAFERTDVVRVMPTGGEAGIGRKEKAMRWLNDLAGVLGLDAAAFSDAAASLEPVFKAAHERIGRLQASIGSFRLNVKDALALSDDDGLDAIAGKIVSLSAKAQADSAALSDAQAKLDEFAAGEKDRLIETLQAEGKMTVAMSEGAFVRGASLDTLREWAKDAPVVVPQGRAAKPEDRSEHGDTLAMSEEAANIARACGLDPQDVAKANGMKYTPAA
jgi:phage I-like protein